MKSGWMDRWMEKTKEKQVFYCYSLFIFPILCYIERVSYLHSCFLLKIYFFFFISSDNRNLNQKMMMRGGEILSRRLIFFFFQKMWEMNEAKREADDTFFKFKFHSMELMVVGHHWH